MKYRLKEDGRFVPNPVYRQAEVVIEAIAARHHELTTTLAASKGEAS